MKIPKILSLCLEGSSISYLFGLGGLGVMCLPQDTMFVGSNLAEVNGVFQDVKILSTSPPGGTLNCGSRIRYYRLVKEPQA